MSHMGRGDETHAGASVETEGACGGETLCERGPHLLCGNGSISVRLPEMPPASKRKKRSTSHLLDMIPELEMQPHGFVSITDAGFECFERAVKFQRWRTLTHGLPFDRIVYRVKWTGGGGLTARVMPDNNIHRKMCYEIKINKTHDS